MSSPLQEPSAAPLLHTLGRHQIASLASTVVDFGTMVLLVQFAHIAPEIATFGGASLGAVANFTLSRFWVFPLAAATSDARRTALRHEAFRYAVVSAGSAAWNSGGELVLHRFLGVQYVLARLLTAVAVSLLWNFPLQRKFVFPRGAEVTTNPSAP